MCFSLLTSLWISTAFFIEFYYIENVNTLINFFYNDNEHLILFLIQMIKYAQYYFMLQLEYKTQGNGKNYYIISMKKEKSIVLLLLFLIKYLTLICNKYFN